MAKAVFQRNQKVWVESVGAWGVIEKIVPLEELDKVFHYVAAGHASGKVVVRVD